HQRRDAFWKHGSVNEDYSSIVCPVFAVGGYLDGYSNAIFRLLANLSVPRMGLIGPWAHAFPHLGVPNPQVNFLAECVRWFDRWLKGESNGIDREPMLRTFLPDSIPAQPFYADLQGRWVAEVEWPSPRIRPIAWDLTPEGQLQPTGSSGSSTVLESTSPLLT